MRPGVRIGCNGGRGRIPSREIATLSRLPGRRSLPVLLGKTSASTRIPPRKPNYWLTPSALAEQNRTRQAPIRTISFIPCQIKIPLNQTPAVYQKLAPKIKELKALGMTNQEIADSMKINQKTVRKGLKC